jgi:hypothetical protein
MLNLSYISGASPVARLYLAGVLVGSDIATIEIGTTGEYFAPVPVATAAGEYVVIFFNGAAKVASGLLFWDGTKEATPLTIEATVDFTEVLDAVGAPLQASAYTAPANADIAAIKAKTDTLVNTDTSALATSAQVTALATATGTPLQASAYTAPPAPATVAAAVRTELAAELGRVDTAVSTRLPATWYTAPDNATALQTKQITIEIQTRVDAALGAPN